MNITAIVSEYNPFHNGHLYQLNAAKAQTNCDGVLVVMSGNFVQRGAPAIIDKWERTSLALVNGADLVLELPVIYSVSSAEFFAWGAVSLLNQLHGIHQLCFGSEHGEVAALLKVAEVLLKEPEIYKVSLKENLSSGLSFPKARSNALMTYFENSLPKALEDILASSNNILGIEYCKSILKLKSDIIPVTVKRIGNLYNDTFLGKEFASATSIREHLRLNKDVHELINYVPSNVYHYLKDSIDQSKGLVFPEMMYPYIKYRSNSNKYSTFPLPDAKEGLFEKFTNEVMKAHSLEELIINVKSKRYTYTRITRLLCQYFLGFDNFPTEELRRLPCPYAKILGFNSKGAKMLKVFKESSDIPLYTKMPRASSPQLELDLMSTGCYSLINPSVGPLEDYYRNPIMKL